MSDQESIKEKILKEIDKTNISIEEFRELSKPIAPDCAIGRVSRMDAINNKSISEASLRQAEKKLENLKRVLKLHGTPEFGLCLKCRQSIPLGRILIRPESLYCIKCAV